MSYLFTGCYGKGFVEKHKEKLEAWSNRVARHPMLSHSFVFRHFLTCAEELVSLFVVVSSCYQLILLLCVHDHTCLYLYLTLLLHSHDTITS